ncbi:MAG: hypothetical protein Kow0098_02440 [Ignavibacteriaceae bacterium]
MRLKLLPVFVFGFCFLLSAQQRVEREYYENDTLKSEITFENGIRNGQAKFYYENGNLKAEMNYVNGKIEGLVRYYSGAGKLSEMFTIENGKREGPTTIFDENGNYLEDIMFDEGKRVVEEPIFTVSSDSDNEQDEEVKTKPKKTGNSERGVDILLPPTIEEIPEDDPAYYLSAEVMPEPKGGIERIQKKIIYPSLARENKIEGVVLVRAFIDEYGTVTKAEVTRGLGYGCDEAAYYAVYYAKFKPGLIKGKPVRVQITIPIEFKLD